MKRRLDRKAVDNLSPALDRKEAIRAAAPDSSPNRCCSAAMFPGRRRSRPTRAPTGRKGPPFNSRQRPCTFFSHACESYYDLKDLHAGHRRLFGKGAGAALEGGALLVDDLDAATSSPIRRDRRADFHWPSCITRESKAAAAASLVGD